MKNSEYKQMPFPEKPISQPSLTEVHRTIKIFNTKHLRKMLAYAGPGYLVSVGYIDPGNWD